MIFDYTNNRSVIVEGGFYDSSVSVSITNDQPDPSAEEFEAAVAIVANDPEFGPALSSKSLEPYPPMPPLTNDPSAKGKPERTVTVGLFPTDDKYQHEIIGVNIDPADDCSFRKRRAAFVERGHVELRRSERGTGDYSQRHCRSGRSRNQPRGNRVLAILMHTPFGIFGV